MEPLGNGGEGGRLGVGGGVCGVRGWRRTE